MSRREYTQKVKIDMPPLIAKIRHDAIVKMKKYVVTLFVEICLS